MRLETTFSSSSSSYQQADHFLSHPYPCHRFIITGIPTTIVITTTTSHVCQSRPDYYTLAHPAIPAHYFTERMHPAPINHYYKTAYGVMEAESGTAKRSGHRLGGQRRTATITTPTSKGAPVLGQVRPVNGVGERSKWASLLRT
jgi:hypothetical protein